MYRNKGMRKRLRLYVGIFLGALGIGSVACYLFFAFPALTAGLNSLVYDTWLKNASLRRPEPEVAVVDIDEASLSRMGQLPWPRSTLADLISDLMACGVAAIGLDLWLTEPDRTSPVAVDGYLEKNFGYSLDLSHIPPLAQDNDRYFRDVIKGKPVALGAYASFEGQGSPASSLPGIEAVEEPPRGGALKARIENAREFIRPLPVFGSGAGIGIMGVYTDNDGMVRRLPLLARVGEQVFPGLSLATLMAACGISSIGIAGGAAGPESVIMGDMRIPVEKNGALRPVYRGAARSLPYFSAIDVMEGKVDPRALAGKIVFIGASAHTLINLRSTPFDPETPDAEIHATVVDNILTRTHITALPHETAASIAAIYLCALLAAPAFCLFSLPVYLLSGAALVAGCLGASWLLFQHGIFYSPAAPCLAVALAAFCILPPRYWREQAERQKLKLAFGRYVSPEIVAKIVTDGEDLLKGEQKRATVLFTDVRSFTAIAERLEPPQLVRLLNSYFTPMTACVMAHHGTLDKFIGDALMAFWNAPLDVPDHAAEAVAAARDMQAALDRLRPALQKEFGVELRMGIGINTGPVHVGNMGSRDLLDYTCIGETVNLASRLEGLCKPYGVGIVVSDAVRESCEGRHRFLQLDRVSVKGSEKPLKIHTLVDGEVDGTIERLWLEALGLYFQAEFARACDRFASLEANVFLGTAARLFTRRCQRLREEPPAQWNGVWMHTSK